MAKKASIETQRKAFKLLERNGFFETSEFYLHLKDLGVWNITKASLYSGRSKLVDYYFNRYTMRGDTLALGIRPCLKCGITD